jgi:hypothetical protein
MVTHRILPRVIDWDDLPAMNELPDVYRDLVHRGFGFIAITRDDGSSEVYAHLGGSEIPFLGTRFQNPHVVSEMLQLFRYLDAHAADYQTTL